MRFVPCCIPLATAYFLFPVAFLAAQPPEAPLTDATAATELPARLEVLRDEAAEDKTTAAALYTHARMLQQRRDFLGALHRYQRAYRYDVQQRGLNAIVSLAMDTGRFDQAVRYAALAPEEVSDSIVLRRLAVEATNRRDWKSAARIYQSLLKPDDTAAAKSAPQVLMQAELARLYFLLGEYEPSSEAFSKVRTALSKPEEYDLNEALQKVILGEHRETYALMARCAVEANRFDSAAELFREAHREAPDSNQALRDSALVLERRDDPVAAEKLLLQALSQGDADAVEPLRRILAKTLPAEDLEAALAEKLVTPQSAHPEDEPLRRALARSFLKQQKFAEAQNLLAEVTAPDEDTLLLQAAAHREQALAESWLLVLAKLATSSSLNATQSEIELAATNEPFAAAVLEYAEQSATETAEQQALQRIAAHLALVRGNFDAAEARFEVSLPVEKPEQGPLLMAWGRRLTQADQYDRAIAVFQRVVAEKLAGDDLGAVYYYLSGAATLGEKFDIALEAARAGTKVRDNDIRFQAREAWVLHHAKRLPEARARYEAILKRYDRLAPADARSEIRSVRLMLSAICLELNDLPRAVELLEEVLDEFPEDTGAMNDLGYIWADHNMHLQRALQMVQRAVAAEPENLAYRDSLGWVLYRLERYPEALAELEKAAADTEPNGVILHHLGDALSKLGRNEEALAAWSKAAAAYRKEGNEIAAWTVEQKK